MPHPVLPGRRGWGRAVSPAPFSHPEWQKLPWDLVSPPSARTVGARASHVASLVTGVLSRGIVLLGLPLFLNCVFQISAPFVYPLSSSKRRPPLRVLLAQALPAPHAGLFRRLFCAWSSFRLSRLSRFTASFLWTSDDDTHSCHHSCLSPSASPAQPLP